MLLKIIAIVVIVTVGFLISATSLGGGGFLTTFFVAFGLISMIGIIGFIVLAKKSKPR
jgi:hypothetical protein